MAIRWFTRRRKIIGATSTRIGLRSCYDEGKRVAETLMMDYHRQSDVDTRIVRIFNTYGDADVGK